MLSRIQRVSNKQFEEVMKKGRIVHSPLFLARMMATPHIKDDIKHPTRIAAVAPVKIAKTAVIRNRTRRVIYEAARSYLAEIKSGQIIAIFAKASALTAKPDEVRDDIHDLFVKAGLLR